MNKTFSPHKPYVFRPPKYSPWLAPLLTLICEHLMLRRKFKVRHVDIQGADKVAEKVHQGHSVLVSPNHADHADPSLLLYTGRRHDLKFHFMAAREGFDKGPFYSFILQRCGAFSVDREGSDVAAIKTALQILSDCRYPLVIFPEGEIYHHHERLDVLFDGVATIRLRSAAKVPEGKKSFLVPAAIHISHDSTVEQTFADRLTRVEDRVIWKARPDTEIIDRIYHLGGGLLALKEEEYLGQAQTGPLMDRINGLQEALVAGIEKQHGVTDAPVSIPDRIKQLRNLIRQKMIQADPAPPPEEKQAMEHDLDTLFLAMQLYSYPGQYIQEKPSLNRIAETIFKLEEDILGDGTYAGPRDARLVFDEPLDVNEFLEQKGLNHKTGTRPLTEFLGERIQTLLEDIGKERSDSQD